MSDAVNKISFQYELLNNANQHKKWLKNVLSCQIRWQSLTQLKSDGLIRMRNDAGIDFINDRIRIYITKNGSQSVLATFLLCSTDGERTENKVENKNCTLYSYLQVLLDAKLEQSYQVGTSTNVVNEVIRLISSYGTYDITASTKTLLSTKTYVIGTSILEVANDLLNTINYTPLYTDKTGKFIAKPYVLPQDRTKEFDWKADINGLIAPGRKNSLDLWNIPNVFVAYTNDININPPLSYTYENNSNNSQTSITARGRRIVKCAAIETTSLDDLTAKAKAMCDEANSAFKHIEFGKGVVTDIDYYMPCGFILGEKYVIYNITYNCAIGQNMQMKARAVVELFV